MNIQITRKDRLLNSFPRLIILFLLVIPSMALFGQQKKLPSKNYDVIVVGGGPSGIGAALAAAEVGAKTLLVERDSRIGGTTVQAEVCDIGLFHAWRKQVIAGPVWELVTGAVAEAGDTLPDFSKQEYNKWMESCVKVDPKIYSRLAEEMLRKAGVELLMNFEVTSIKRTKKGWKIGPATGKQIVDATGNATVAALAGAERIKSSDEVRQPGSYFFWLSSKGLKFDTEAVDRAHKKAIADGELLPTDVHVGMPWFIRKGGGSGCYVPLADNSTPEAREETNRRGREARDRVIAFIRKQKGLENVVVTKSASEVGVRETYRVIGEKTITESDYLAGTIPDDALAWSYWMVDQHNAGKSSARLVFHKEGKAGVIPLGAMLPKGVDHMLVAGRAVSSDHGANSALRVQASCMAMGQAAGVVAALAASQNCDPRNVPLDLARQRLTDIGHIVPSEKTAPTNTSKWTQLADGMVEALIQNFWGPNFEGYPNRYYFNYKSHLADLTSGHYWPQAHAMDVIIDAYMRTKDQKYRDFYPLWWLGAPTFNFAKNSKGAWWNPYVDDMEWMALTQIRMFESTGNAIYISKAREIYDEWIWTTWGPEDEAPWYGGITWKTDIGKSKNACSNGPAAIIAARLYRFYDQAGFSYGKDKEQYLNEATKIYQWIRKYLFDANTGAVQDNMHASGRIDPAVYTYNQGTFIGAAHELYQITGEKQYLEDAVKAVEYVMTKMTQSNNGVLRDAPGGDGGLFHGIFFRYFVKLTNEKSLPMETRKKFHQFLTHHATVMANEGLNQTTMLYGGKWREKPEDETPVSLTAHVTGCMLMEAMCVLEANFE